MKIPVPLLLLLAALSVSTGCDVLRYGAYVLAPGSKVPAEYELEGSRVAVMVYTSRRTDFEYPTLQRDLTFAITSELNTHVANVQMVPPREILRYQQSRLDWLSRDRAQVSRDLGADHLLLVSVIEYSTREAGSMGIYRGRLLGEAKLYAASQENADTPLWQTAQPILAEHPDGAGVGHVSMNPAEIPFHTVRKFVESLGRRFYTHQPEDDR